MSQTARPVPPGFQPVETRGFTGFAGPVLRGRDSQCSLYILDIAAQFRAMGGQATGEACIQYLCMTEDDIVRLAGRGKCNPPFRTAAAVSGRIGAVGSFHGGGLEQVRHPAHEVEQATAVDLSPADALGLGDDEGDTAADKRAMDQARSLAASRTVYAIDSASSRPDDLQLDF